MRLGALLPQQAAGLRFDRVKPARGIAEQKGMLVSQRNRQDGRAHWACGLKDPLDAPGFDVEGLHQATGASHEEMTIENRRLGEGNDVAIESIRPLQLKARYLTKREAGCIAGLIARIGEGRAPSVPFRFTPAG